MKSFTTCTSKLAFLTRKNKKIKKNLCLPTAAELLRCVWRWDSSHPKSRPGAAAPLWTHRPCSVVWVRVLVSRFNRFFTHHFLQFDQLCSFYSIVHMGPFQRLQDISCGYWVLVLHFTRSEAVRQIDELQHIATNLGRSKLPVSHSWNLYMCCYFKIKFETIALLLPV